MKAFLALGVRKSVSKEFAYGKFDFLDLIDFDFLDLAKFTTVDRFLILPLFLPPSTPPAILGASWFFAWVFWDLLPIGLSIIWNTRMDEATILLKFLMNLL